MVGPAKICRLGLEAGRPGRLERRPDPRSGRRASEPRWTTTSRACAIDISYHRHRLETDRCQPVRVASDARRAMAPMIDWWSETDHAILECLRETGPMSPH